MNLCIVGCGYVGLVTGTCLSEMGNDVAMVDVDRERVRALTTGEVPIYEPGLAELVRRNADEGRLRFTVDLASAVEGTRAILVCVGTPPAPDGSSDLTALMDVVRGIGESMDGYRLIVVKSTVPVGTCRRVAEMLAGLTEHEFDVASNPEFLKAGAAVNDFLRPDRVVVGVESDRALQVLRELYAPFLRTGRPLIAMSVPSAEITKQAANTMLAARISLINELAALCEATCADVEEVRMGIASDSRIGPQFLFPGLGFGGSCLPKDTRSLAHAGMEHGIPMHITRASYTVNDEGRQRFLDRIASHFAGDLSAATLAFWGTAFKPRTDDVRESPGIWLIQQVLARWPTCSVRAHDEVARRTSMAVLPRQVEFAPSQYDVLTGADALVICTDCNEFRSPNFARMKQLLAAPVIFDGRNLYAADTMGREGFTYYSIGRQPVRRQPAPSG
jgi:UDPglucose 6-dehydrogenase